MPLLLQNQSVLVDAENDISLYLLHYIFRDYGSGCNLVHWNLVL